LREGLRGARAFWIPFEISRHTCVPPPFPSSSYLGESCNAALFFSSPFRASSAEASLLVSLSSGEVRKTLRFSSLVSCVKEIEFPCFPVRGGKSEGVPSRYILGPGLSAAIPLFFLLKKDAFSPFLPSHIEPRSHEGGWRLRTLLGVRVSQDTTIRFWHLKSRVELVALVRIPFFLPSFAPRNCGCSLSSRFFYSETIAPPAIAVGIHAASSPRLLDQAKSSPLRARSAIKGGFLMLLAGRLMSPRRCHQPTY